MRIVDACRLSRFYQAGRYDSFKKRFTLATWEHGAVHYYRTNKKGKNLSYWIPRGNDPFAYTDWLPIAPFANKDKS